MSLFIEKYTVRNLIVVVPLVKKYFYRFCMSCDRYPKAIEVEGLTGCELWKTPAEVTSIEEVN